MNTVPLLPELKTAPAVFAVGRDYQIMALVKSDLLFWVTVGDHAFYDHTNGIMRSSVRVHTVTVPASLLDGAGSYTVHYRKVINRKPYFPESEETVSATYPFYPVPTDRPVRIYHLADTHGNFEMPLAAASYFGEAPDLLILNGDIPDHSGDVAYFDLIYKLAEGVTGGSRPVIFSRGNHDTRGLCAEQITSYAPTDGGRSYFTFRVGNVWGIVLDCGEDKPDDHDAYRYTNVCHHFRLAQTDFIKQVIVNAASEYAAEGVTHRLVIAHNPFSYTYKEPFNIEYDIYTEWVELLAAHVRPDALIAGHLHYAEVKQEGGELDTAGAIPVIVGSAVRRDENHRFTHYMGAALTLGQGSIKVAFTNHLGQAEVEHELVLREL
ncbi:MAG: metallophosphoesterase [Clostridia bacterium]|nr:metallophosphoesterase [Clostridia bacterium]